MGDAKTSQAGGTRDLTHVIVRGMEGRKIINQGLDLEALLSRVADYYGIDINNLRTGSRQRAIVRARSVFCFLAVGKGVSKSVIRGQSVLREQGIEDIEKALLEC